MFFLGISEVLFLFVLLPLAVITWGIVDGARRPDSAWKAAGESKTLWIALQAIGLFFSLLGLILTVVYLAVIRPRVAAAERSSDATLS